MNEGVLVVGINSLVGSSLGQRAERAGTIWWGTSRRTGNNDRLIKLDLSSDEEIDKLSVFPAITYLCAAETNIRKCQNEISKTRRLNVEQTIKIARKLHDRGSNLVFLSTSLVFDGNRPYVPPDEVYSPVTEYGKQKADVEKILLKDFERAAIVRLTKVVHEDLKLFREWRTALQNQVKIHPFSDMYFCPIGLDAVTEGLWAFSHSFRLGVFQLSGESEISYALAARIMAECRGYDASLIEAKTAAEVGFLEYFPRHTTLEYRPLELRSGPLSTALVLQRLFAGP